jgi:hypothetical protein
MQIEFTLRRKRDEIEAAIHACEAKIEAARTNLAAIEATIRLFDPEARCDETAMGSEPRKILAAPPKTLEYPGRLDTRQLPLPVAKAKGLAILFKAVRIQVSRALSATSRSLAPDDGKGNGMRLWSGMETRSAQAREHKGEVGPRSASSQRIPEEFFYLDWP